MSSDRNLPRIAQAMDELRERRDSGEHISLIVRDVAEAHEVDADLLRQNAEKSWGTPLGSDRLRNWEHFKVLDRYKAVEELANGTAEKSWHYNIPNGGRPNWNIGFERLVADLELDDEHLKQVASDAYFSTIERLNQKYGARVAQN